MASLVGQQLKDTYDSLLKTSDNDALGGTYKEITDGLGNGSNLYLGTGGNVGIGTTSPSEPLTILSAQDYQITAAYNATNSTSYGYYGIKNNNTGNPFYFHVGGAERMRIDSSGNVGIGETSPDANLEVNGSVIAGGQRFETINKSVDIGSSVDFDISCLASARGFVRVKIIVGYVGNNIYQMHAQYDYININSATSGATATRTDIFQNEAGNAQFNYSDITVSRPSNGVIRITYAPTSGAGTHQPQLYIDGVFNSVS